LVGSSTALSFALLSLVRSYQRFVSPYKGWVCGYRRLRERDSCSNYAARVLARVRLGKAVLLVVRRLHACRQVVEASRHEVTASRAVDDAENGESPDREPANPEELEKARQRLDRSSPALRCADIIGSCG
jgi:putative component of membrane protein insertase Oxa1/YidC/SpoIIIJ protein YidD